MKYYSLSYPKVILTFSQYTLFPTNEATTTESQRYNCFNRHGGNGTPHHACPEADGNNPTTGLTLLWARNPFRGNFNYWQVSQEEAGQIFLKRRLGNEKGITI
jgi:hypothetical protein